MPISDQRKRLALLEGQIKADIDQAQERFNARVVELLTADELDGLTSYFRRQKADPTAEPEGAEVAAVDRLNALRSDPEIAALDQTYGWLHWALLWGESWQARH